MGKLVFFYTNHGSHRDVPKKWAKDTKSKNPYVEILTTEGYYILCRELKKRGFVEDVLFIIESNRSPGYFEHEGMKGFTVPHIRSSREFIEKGDILWARGGFRTWHDYLVELQNEGFWTMLYAANTGRERWEFWDIILDDLKPTENMDRLGRLWLFFKKPMNSEIFYPTMHTKKYDLCIGASHIHDKKGQHKTLSALWELKRETGIVLKCVMPGSFRGGTYTRPWLNPEALGEIGVEAPGMVNRYKLAELYNQSHLFCYLGGAGQGDRGPMEAMACGVPLFIGPTKRLAPVIYNNQDVTYICKEHEYPDLCGKELLKWLERVKSDSNIAEKTFKHFNALNSLDVATNFMGEIFNFLNNNPEQNKGVLKKYAESRKATIAYNL